MHVSSPEPLKAPVKSDALDSKLHSDKSAFSQQSIVAASKFVAPAHNQANPMVQVSGTIREGNNFFYPGKSFFVLLFDAVICLCVEMPTVKHILFFLHVSHSEPC